MADHVVYTDSKADELSKIVSGTKTMILRGAAGRKLPYGRVDPGDILYFVENDGSGFVQGRAIVKNVLNSEKLTPEESTAMVEERQRFLQFTEKQFK